LGCRVGKQLAVFPSFQNHSPIQPPTIPSRRAERNPSPPPVTKTNQLASPPVGQPLAEGGGAEQPALFQVSRQRDQEAVALQVGRAAAEGVVAGAGLGAHALVAVAGLVVPRGWGSARGVFGVVRVRVAVCFRLMTEG